MTLFTLHPAFNTLKVLKYFTVLLAITIFSGCAVSNFKTVNNTRLIDPYGKIAVIVINTQEELIDFTEQSFDDLVRPSLNDLKNIEVRSQLEKSFQNNLSSAHTAVVKSSDLFRVHENVSYDGFMNQLKDNKVEAVLVLNMSGYWNTYSESNNAIPNASFLCYLIDLKSGQQVWLATSTVNGTTEWAAYDNVCNTLARGASRKLYKAGFIYKSGFPYVEPGQ